MDQNISLRDNEANNVGTALIILLGLGFLYFLTLTRKSIILRNVPNIVNRENTRFASFDIKFTR